jgi:hypothetical protein
MCRAAAPEATAALFAALDGIVDTRPQWAVAGANVRIFGLHRAEMRCYNGCVGTIYKDDDSSNSTTAAVRVIGFNKLVSVPLHNLAPIAEAPASPIPIQSLCHAEAESANSDRRTLKPKPTESASGDALASLFDRGDGLSVPEPEPEPEPEPAECANLGPHSAFLAHAARPPKLHVIALGSNLHCNLLLDLSGISRTPLATKQSAEDEAGTSFVVSGPSRVQRLQRASECAESRRTDLAESPTSSSGSDSCSQAATVRAASELESSGGSALCDGSSDLVDI